MQFFSIVQVVYLFLSLIGTTIWVVALVTVLSWPAVRGRVLLLLCLLLKLAAGGGYLAMGLLHVVNIFDRLGPQFASGELMQVAYMLLAVISLTGDGFLLAGLIRLAGALRASGKPESSPWRME